MSCTKDLRMWLLPDAPSGGSWNFIGFNPIDPCGSFSYPNGTDFSPLNGDNPTVDLDGATAGFYRAVYTVNGTTVKATWHVIGKPDAGSAVPAEFCVNDTQMIDLYNYLNGETSGGVFVENQSTPLPGLDQDGRLDLSQVNSSGTYYVTYEIDGEDESYEGFDYSECVDCVDSVVLEIVISEEANAGDDGSITVCNGSGCSVDLFDYLGGNPDINGDWEMKTGPQPINPLGYKGSVDWSGKSVGTYTFVYEVGNVGCGNNTATVTVEVVGQASAGNGSDLEVCESDGNINLYSQLFGEDSGGVWSVDILPPNGNFNPANGSYEPEIGDGGSGSVDYVFTYNVGANVVNDCNNSCQDSESFTVTVNKVANAGSGAGFNNPEKVCKNDTIKLGDYLDAGADLGGKWKVLFHDENCSGGGQNGSNTFSVNGGVTEPHGINEVISQSEVANVSDFLDTGCYLFQYCVENGNCGEDCATFVFEITDCTEPCEGVEVSIYESNDILYANENGCSGGASFVWEYSVTGSGSWSTVGSGSSHNPSQTGYYRVTLSCDGCSVDDGYYYEIPCAASVNIIELGNGDYSANVSGCSGVVTYSWTLFPADGGSPVNYGNSQNITPDTNGDYQVIINCDGCTAMDFKTYSGGGGGCMIEVQMSYNSGTGKFEIDNISNGSAPYSYTWQYSPMGSGWTTIGSGSTQSPTEGEGYYRLIVIDDDNCPAEDMEFYTDPCGGSVSISEQTCGEKDVDYIFFIDSSASVSSSEFTDMKASIDATIDKISANTEINPRFAIVQYYSDANYNGKLDIPVNFTPIPSAAKNFTHRSGIGAPLNECYGLLIGKLGNVLNLRSGADFKIILFTDSPRSGTSNLVPFTNSNTLRGSSWNAEILVVHYPNSSGSIAKEPGAANASVGEDYNGVIEANTGDPEGSGTKPRHYFPLSGFDKTVPTLGIYAGCVQILADLSNTCNNPVLFWEYRSNSQGNWTTLSESSNPLDVSNEGEYRAKVVCSGCEYYSNVIVV